jgi:hypothetical protein
MPPKKTAAQAAPAEVVEQEPIQAVVLADSFNRRFEVLCVDKPRVSEDMSCACTGQPKLTGNLFTVPAPATRHSDAGVDP